MKCSFKDHKGEKNIESDEKQMLMWSYWFWSYWYIKKTKTEKNLFKVYNSDTKGKRCSKRAFHITFIIIESLCNVAKYINDV